MKKDNQEESKFMQLWHNKRTHAAMVLGLWGIFLLFVIIISYIGGEATQNEVNNNQNTNQVEEEQKVFKDYIEMQSDLLKNNYEYEYIITVADSKVVYKGERIDATETGYRENSLETIKYYIDETGLYKVLMDELYAMDKLYENINESYIDLEYIFNEIKNMSVTTEEVEETRTYTYNYVIENINYEVIVTTNLDAITKIAIKFEDKQYELNYSKINELENLSFIPKEVN